MTANVDTTTCTTPALGKSHLSILVVVGNGRYDIMLCCSFHAGHATWDTCDCHVSGILETANVNTTTCTTPALGKGHLSILVVVGNGRYDIAPCCSFHASHATWDIQHPRDSQCGYHNLHNSCAWQKSFIHTGCRSLAVASRSGFPGQVNAISAMCLQAARAPCH
jgi:hypothetical protein